MHWLFKRTPKYYGGINDDDFYGEITNFIAISLIWPMGLSYSKNKSNSLPVSYVKFLFLQFSWGKDCEWIGV